MIRFENVGLASPEQMEFIIEGMRNPMNSWEKSDSETWIDAFNNGVIQLKNVTIVVIKLDAWMPTIFISEKTTTHSCSVFPMRAQSIENI